MLVLYNSPMRYVFHLFVYLLKCFSIVDTHFQICANGLVSFDREFRQPIPARDESLHGGYLVAPFYASVDMESPNAGSVFYRVVDLLNNQTDITSPAVKQLEQLVTKSTNGPNDFTASTFIVVTWENILPGQRTIFSTTVETKFIRSCNVHINNTHKSFY